MSQYTIKHVAIYVRKSRGDAETDLERHTQELVHLCEDNGWAYVVYAEIGSSDSIELRPKMLELLQDIELCMYDAVVAIHIDRLSRGDGEDRAKIQKILGKTETLLITPQRVYDLTNETDLMMAEFEGLMARMEYKQTTRRFKAGKARNAKLGFWSNGRPPYPYVRDQILKKAVVIPEHKTVYRMMVDLYLQGWTFTDIAWKLNQMGIPSAKRGLWSHVVVSSLLVDEVHLGHMVVGKTVKVATGAKIHKDKSEWIVYKNCHEAVKSQDEHDRILFLVNRNKKTSSVTRSGRQQFSGILFCYCCEKGMQIQKNKSRPSDTVRSCKTHDAYGVRCINLGGNANILQDAVEQALLLKKSKLEEALSDKLSENDVRELQDVLQMKLKEIKQVEKSIDKIYLNQERMLYSDDDDENDAIFSSRLSKAKIELGKLEEEFALLDNQVNRARNIKNEELLLNTEDVIAMLRKPKISEKDKNRALKSVIKKIIWKRLSADSEPEIYINFL